MFSKKYKELQKWTPKEIEVATKIKVNLESKLFTSK